jgi:ankyrin repeat protein
MKKALKPFYPLVLFSLLAACATTTARTPLMKAVEEGNRDAVKQLLNSGVNVNEKSDYDIGPGGKEWIALHLAAKKGDANMTRLLLDHGADPNIGTKMRWTPLKWAEHNGNTFVAQMLREAMEKEARKPLEGAKVAYEKKRIGHPECPSNPPLNLDPRRTAPKLPYGIWLRGIPPSLTLRN